jgi:hopanoid biosynthesis associated protein HpnK
MVNGAAVDDAVERARRLPSLRVGLHLVLIDGRPVLPRERIPDLVDARGELRADMVMLGLDMVLRRKVRAQLAAEIEAQFAAFRATGLPLDHVNAHHHFHVHPTIAGQIVDIGKRYGMTAVRVPLERATLLDRVEPFCRHRRHWIADPWTALLGTRLRRHGLSAPDQVVGIAWSGAMTEQRTAGVLKNLPNGITEIYFHPATVDTFDGAASGYRYVEELAALIAPGMKELVRVTGARTGGFSDCAAR